MGKHVVWAWVKECWRPVDSYRVVTKGRKKGWLEVVLPDGRKHIIERSHTRGLPPESRKDMK
jgi:hypothetical protein